MDSADSQIEENNEHPENSLEQSLLTRLDGALTTPGVQRSLQRSISAARSSFSSADTQAIVQRVSNRIDKPVVWEPSIGSLSPEMVFRFSNEVKDRYPNLAGKYSVESPEAEEGTGSELTLAQSTGSSSNVQLRRRSTNYGETGIPEPIQPGPPSFGEPEEKERQKPERVIHAPPAVQRKPGVRPVSRIEEVTPASNSRETPAPVQRSEQPEDNPLASIDRSTEKTPTRAFPETRSGEFQEEAIVRRKPEPIQEKTAEIAEEAIPSDRPKNLKVDSTQIPTFEPRRPRPVLQRQAEEQKPLEREASTPKSEPVQRKAVETSPPENLTDSHEVETEMPSSSDPGIDIGDGQLPQPDEENEPPKDTSPAYLRGLQREVEETLQGMEKSLPLAPTRTTAKVKSISEAADEGSHQQAAAIPSIQRKNEPVDRKTALQRAPAHLQIPQARESVERSPIKVQRQAEEKPLEQKHPVDPSVPPAAELLTTPGQPVAQRAPVAKLDQPDTTPDKKAIPVKSLTDTPLPGVEDFQNTQEESLAQLAPAIETSQPETTHDGQPALDESSHVSEVDKQERIRQDENEFPELILPPTPERANEEVQDLSAPSITDQSLAASIQRKYEGGSVGDDHKSMPASKHIESTPPGIQESEPDSRDSVPDSNRAEGSLPGLRTNFVQRDAVKVEQTGEQGVLSENDKLREKSDKLASSPKALPLQMKAEDISQPLPLAKSEKSVDIRPTRLYPLESSDENTDFSQVQGVEEPASHSAALPQEQVQRAAGTEVPVPGEQPLQRKHEEPSTPAKAAPVERHPSLTHHVDNSPEAPGIERIQRFDTGRTANKPDLQRQNQNIQSATDHDDTKPSQRKQKDIETLLPGDLRETGEIKRSETKESVGQHTVDQDGAVHSLHDILDDAKETKYEETRGDLPQRPMIQRDALYPPHDILDDAKGIKHVETGVDPQPSMIQRDDVYSTHDDSEDSIESKLQDTRDNFKQRPTIQRDTSLPPYDVLEEQKGSKPQETREHSIFNAQRKAREIQPSADRGKIQRTSKPEQQSTQQPAEAGNRNMESREASQTGEDGPLTQTQKKDNVQRQTRDSGIERETKGPENDSEFLETRETPTETFPYPPGKVETSEDHGRSGISDRLQRSPVEQYGQYEETGPEPDRSRSGDPGISEPPAPKIEPLHRAARIQRKVGLADEIIRRDVDRRRLPLTSSQETGDFQNADRDSQPLLHTYTNTGTSDPDGSMESDIPGLQQKPGTQGSAQNLPYKKASPSIQRAQFPRAELPLWGNPVSVQSTAVAASVPKADPVIAAIEPRPVTETVQRLPLAVPPRIEVKPAIESNIRRSIEPENSVETTVVTAEEPEPDLNDLARKVYPLIKRLLAIERERFAGR